MTADKQLVHNFILLATFTACFVGLFIPREWIGDYLVVFAIALILAGIPHGASDYLIFRQVSAVFHSKADTLSFYIFYILVTGVYIALWYIFPAIAFSLFLLISVYHFGQSNWSEVKFQGDTPAIFTNMLWGSAVVAVPVLLYSEESFLIISEVTGRQVAMSGSMRWAVIFLLLLGNLVNIAHLFHNGTLDEKAFRKEIGSFLTLMLLFLTTPLLVGFGIYFVLWHSLGSVMDQVRLLRMRDKGFHIGQYLRQVVPLSLLAFAGLALLYLLFGETFNRGLNLGALFFFISVITVPHAILMDKFYKTANPALPPEQE